MRERFSEINITGTINAIPVGADAQNITLKDGSILEQALGDIKFQENGSIIDQINKVDKKIREDADYAPLTAPRIKDAFSVRRYNKDNILSVIPSVGGTKRGITTKYSSYEWKVNGSITSGNNTIITLYGTDDHSASLAGPSDYLVKIKNNTNVLIGNNQNPIISLRFDIYNSTTGTTSIYVYQGDETKNFNIPINSFLYRVGLNIYAGNENTTIQNGILKFEIKDQNDQQQDTFNVVFDVQQNLDNKEWTTTVAENFVVSKGLQSQARSSLGTIYDSKWEGDLNVSGIINVTHPSDDKAGLIMHNGPIGFVVNNLNDYSGSTTSEKAASQREGVFPLLQQTTPYFIAPMYLNEGDGILRYGSPQGHNFYVGTDSQNGSGQFVVTAQKTKIRNILELGNNKVYSSRIIQYFAPQHFADIENILLDTNYPSWTPFIVYTNAVLGRWFAWRNDNETMRSIGIGWIWRNFASGEYAFCGFAMSASPLAEYFCSNPGLFRYRYSFYPNQSNKKRKFMSYKICNANPSTINQYVHIRLGQGMNGTGTNVASDKRGMWTSFTKGTSLTQ